MAVKHALFALALTGFAAAVHAQTLAPRASDPLPRARPEQVGMSPERLAQIGAVLDQDVEQGKIPGAVLAIARDGKLVFLEAYGFRDKAAGVRMTTDTIFNIASMTKPMAALAALTLAEQGKLVIDEPIGRHLPGFTDTKVATQDAGGEAVTGTVPAARPITLRDLMTHTSGLVYGGQGSTAVHKMYPAGSSAAARQMTGPEFLAKLSGLPLWHQPGTTWHGTTVSAWTWPA